jgi:hypothetical protein
MHNRTVIVALLVLPAFCASPVNAFAFDDDQYPAWKGQWTRIGDAARWDITKPRGLGQEAPLTPEYQAKYEASLADEAAGGQGLNMMARC